MRLYRPLEQWGSRSTFLLVLCAAALGMGNWWRFAFLLGENGGAPFMLAYVVALLLLSVPLLVAELVVGRIGRRAPLLSLGWVAALSGRSRLWGLAGVIGLLCALALAATALLLGGWALAYAFHHQLGSFAAISLLDAGAFFEELSASPGRGIAWQAFGALSLVVAAMAGVRRGVGTAVWLSVPLMLVLFYVLLEFALSHGDMDRATAYLFARQSMDFHAGSIALAFMQALYTLAIGVAAGLAMGASAGDDVPLLRSALAVAVLDTVVSVALGVLVLALCFAVNLRPQEGFGLLFVGLPYAFGNVAFGDFYGALFYFALFVAAMSLALALLEPVITTLQQQLRLHRLQASLLAGGLVWSLAYLALDSIAPQAQLPDFLARLGDVTAHLLPAGALLLALFVGWRVPRELLRRELCREPDFLFRLWYFALRFAVPPGLFLAWLGTRLLP